MPALPSLCAARSTDTHRTGCKLTGCKLIGCKPSGCKLSGCKLTNCKFTAPVASSPHRLQAHQLQAAGIVAAVGGKQQLNPRELVLSLPGGVMPHAVLPLAHGTRFPHAAYLCNCA